MDFLGVMLCHMPGDLLLQRKKHGKSNTQTDMRILHVRTGCPLTLNLSSSFENRSQNCTILQVLIISSMRRSVS